MTRIRRIYADQMLSYITFRSAQIRKIRVIRGLFCVANLC
jgi:hypothetical protein